MNYSLVFLVLCWITVNARPQSQQPANPQVAAQSAQSGNTPVPILNQTQEVGPDGTYNFSFGTGDGIYQQQSGYIKKGEVTSRSGINGNETSDGDILVIQGSVSYTAPDGQVINLKYIADENGYQPEGEHIPTNAPPSGAGATAVGQQQQQNQQYQTGQQYHSAQQYQQQPGQQGLRNNPIVAA